MYYTQWSSIKLAQLFQNTEANDGNSYPRRTQDYSVKQGWAQIRQLIQYTLRKKGLTGF